MTTVEIVQSKADGLHLAAGASLARLLADDLLRPFADGLLPRAAAATLPGIAPNVSLTEMLFSPEPAFGGLLAALLALDAEVVANVNDDRRVWPLPGFLSYRSRLAAHPPHEVRLPPLNPDGHYLLSTGGNRTLVLRFDMHPRLRVLGHVRIVITGKAPPRRLAALEHRLERSVLTGPLLNEIEIAGAAGDLEADPAALSRLLSLLREFAGDQLGFTG
ncbi:MAG: hypothetical protein Kow0031_01080 [Anaerolineae bacterium]